MAETTAPEAPQTVEANPGIVNPGESLVSFDDIEAIDTFKSQEMRQEVIEEAAKEQERKTLEKEGAIKAKPQHEDDASENVADEAEVEASGDEEAAKVEEPVVEEDVKVFKVVKGDEEIDLPGNSIHKVKSDGEELEVKYEDLINSYSGQKAIQKRFGELGTEKKQLIAEKSTWMREKASFDQNIQQAVNLLSSNPVAGISHLARIANLDDQKFVSEFTDKISQLVDHYSTMTADERRMYEHQIMTEQREAHLQTRESEIQAQQQQNALLSEVKQIQAVNKIADEEFSETFFELEQMQRDGKITGDITPQFVADVIKYDRAEGKVKAVIEVVRPSLLKDGDALNDLVQVLNQQDPEGEFTEDDIKDIVVNAFPNMNADNLSKKVAKTGSGRPKESKPSYDPQNEPLTFDDLY